MGAKFRKFLISQNLINSFIEVGNLWYAEWYLITQHSRSSYLEKNWPNYTWSLPQEELKHKDLAFQSLSSLPSAEKYKQSKTFHCLWNCVYYLLGIIFCFSSLVANCNAMYICLGLSSLKGHWLGHLVK